MSFLVSPLPAVPSCPGGSVSESNGRKVVGEGPCLILEAAPGKYHEGFQLGCRQSCCHDLVLSWPRGPSVSLPRPRGVPHRVISAARVSLSAPWPLAEDQPQNRHFQHPTSSWNSPSAQPLMLHLWLLQQEIVSILQRGKLRHGEEKNLPASAFPWPLSHSASLGPCLQHPPVTQVWAGEWKSRELCLEMMQQQDGDKPPAPRGRCWGDGGRGRSSASGVTLSP